MEHDVDHSNKRDVYCMEYANRSTCEQCIQYWHNPFHYVQDGGFVCERVCIRVSCRSVQPLQQCDSKSHFCTNDKQQPVNLLVPDSGVSLDPAAPLRYLQ